MILSFGETCFKCFSRLKHTHVSLFVSLNSDVTVKVSREMTRFGQLFGKIRGKRWFIPSLAGAALVILLAAGGYFLFRPAQLDGLTIHGSRRFKSRVIDSLSLLRAKVPDAYQIVTNNIGSIAQSKQTSLAMYRKPPTFEMSAAIAYASVTWCAGCIAHDAMHARFHSTWLRFHGSEKVVPYDAWMGGNAEMLCSAHQVRVLSQIGAPAKELTQCTSVPANHSWEVSYQKPK